MQNTSFILPNNQNFKNIISAKNIQNSNQQTIKNNSTPQLKCDKIELKKQKSDLKSKLIPVSILSGLGIISGIAIKKRINSSKVKQLAKAINFKPANTIEEAIDYTKKNFKIKKITGFKSSDLEYLNWINEGLTLTSNKHQGKIAMPYKLEMVDEIQTATGESGAGGFGGIFKDTISILRSEFNDKEEIFKEILQESRPEFFTTFKNPTYTDYAKSVAALSQEKYNGHVCQKYIPAIDCPFGVIVHEMGHLQHNKALKNNKLFLSLGKPAEQPEKVAKGAKELQELFKNSKELIENEAGYYATESPCEFVAELYTRIIHGEKVSNEALELYKKFGGVII